MQQQILAAVKLHRRIASVVILHRSQIDYAKFRYLPATTEEAEKTLRGFLHWIIESFDVGSAAIEISKSSSDTHVSHFQEVCREVFHSLGIPVWEVPLDEIFSAFGVPPLKSREALRQVITTIWPILNAPEFTDHTQDAAAVGLYAQVERLLAPNSSPNPTEP